MVQQKQPRAFTSHFHQAQQGTLYQASTNSTRSEKERVVNANNHITSSAYHLSHTPSRVSLL